MSVGRSRKTEIAYKKFRHSEPQDECTFCIIPDSSSQVVSEHTHFRILHNLFPYAYWDDQRVEDHLMIVPRTHTDSLGHMNAKQQAEYFKLVLEYEAKGYNLYARAPQSKRKSVVHQHSHLIRTSGPATRFSMLLHKPFIHIAVG